VTDRGTGLNVPNTLLKKDIRDVTAAPHQKVYAVLSKKYADEKYFELEKEDKLLNIQECRFTQEIENYLDREKL
jgi:hypothetical protein